MKPSEIVNKQIPLFTIQQRYKYYLSCFIFLMRIYPSTLLSESAFLFSCASMHMRFFPVLFFRMCFIPVRFFPVTTKNNIQPIELETSESEKLGIKISLETIFSFIHLWCKTVYDFTAIVKPTKLFCTTFLIFFCCLPHNYSKECCCNVSISTTLRYQLTPKI